MKKRFLLLFFALMFVSLSNVKASTCSNERILELSSLANNIKVSTQKDMRVSEKTFSEELNEEIESTFPAFYVTIFNLPDDLNVSVTREDTHKTVYANTKNLNSDGVLYIDAGFATMVKTFTIKIRSNDSSCKNEVLKTVTVSTPMYNLNSQYSVCKENSDFSMCKEFTTVDYSDVSQSKFDEELEKYKEEKAKEEKRENSIFVKLANFISEYRWIFITAIIIAIAFAVVYIINRKKSRLV